MFFMIEVNLYGVEGFEAVLSRSSNRRVLEAAG